MKTLLLIEKEIKDLLKSKSFLLYSFILFYITAYSFYSAVDLYSKASMAAINNPLYATGFEPVAGVFVPTFGGLFIVLSLFSPFVLIRIFGIEKSNNTISLVRQIDFSETEIFLSKLSSGLFFILLSLIAFLPLLIIWKTIGGHLPKVELFLLFFGYLLYGTFVVSISIFSSVIMKTTAQASIFAIALIVFSWFLDFGKDMHIFSYLDKISDWTVTSQLKEFESGIFSLQAVFYFLILSSFILLLSFVAFNINLRRKVKLSALLTIFFILLFFFNTLYQYKRDLTESGKHSFSYEETVFLKKLPEIKIKVFLEPTDSRYRDYENDFLKKLKMVKTDVKINFAEGKELKENYGLFEYTINGETAKTYSNSAKEIFLVLEELSGKKIEKSDKKSSVYKGYPLVVKRGWSHSLFFIYLILFPIFLILFQLKKPRRKKI